MIEIELMRMFLASYRHSRVRLFRRNIIDKTVQEMRTGRVIQMKAGLPGQADAYGFIRNPQISLLDRLELPPIPIEIEFKGQKTRVSPEQKNWRAFCDEYQVPYLILRAGVEESSGFTITRWTDEMHRFVHKQVTRFS